MKTKSLLKTVAVIMLLTIISVNGLQAQKSYKRQAIIQSVFYKNEIRHEFSNRIFKEMDRIQENALYLAEWMYNPSKWNTGETLSIDTRLQPDEETGLYLEPWMTEVQEIAPWVSETELELEKWMVNPESWN
ncbi:MAG: hypothetical protein ACOCXW_00525 [Bacteroidota bacterium]